MKFLSYLTEEYCCLIGQKEIYVNPTYDDLKRSKCKEYRFAADCRTQKLFIWDSYIANHYEVIKHLIQSGYISKKDITLRNYYYISLDLISGMAELQDKKLVMFDSDELDDLEDQNIKDKLLTREWGWMKKYMNIDELFHIQRQIKK
jgi:hypothetical protein